jgi:fatty acid synthase
VIQITAESYTWVEDIKAALTKSESEGLKVLLVSQEETNGIVGLVNCLTKEPGGANLRYVIVI